MKRDVLYGIFPYAAAAVASSLHSGSPSSNRPSVLVPIIAKSLAYAFLFLYSFNFSNQLTGIAEDTINKSDRQIPSGLKTERATRVRYLCCTV
jgi:hypothetical protein